MSKNVLGQYNLAKNVLGQFFSQKKAHFCKIALFSPKRLLKTSARARRRVRGHERQRDLKGSIDRYLLR